jgi:uncharacterized membrane protein
VSLPQSATAQRLQFVDVLRGWAVIVMIETHVVNALLKPEIREQSFFSIVNFLNGLVAPSFLFCAGFSLAIILQKRWNDFLSFSPSLWKYFWRLFYILLLGYSLHIPYFSLEKMLGPLTERDWNRFLQADILHTITITLVLLVAVVLVIRKECTSVGSWTTLGLLFVFFAPILREFDLSSLPMWFRGYLTNQFKSQFPLFPWSGFVIGGAITGYWYLYYKKREIETIWMGSLAWYAALFIILSILMEISPLTLYPNHNFWSASPEFFFVRLGIVLMLMFFFWKLEQNSIIYLPTKWPLRDSPIVLFGQESLIVYVVHLLIVYGDDEKLSMIKRWGKTMNFAECLSLSLALIVAMYLLAYGWHWLKGKNKKAANYVLAGILLISAIRFAVD